jgi:uncharacterized repeat protein (TIGR03803 family)
MKHAVLLVLLGISLSACSNSALVAGNAVPQVGSPTVASAKAGKSFSQPLPNAYSYRILHSFGSGTDGADPEFSLVADDSGNLYGVTAAGGPENAGIVFKVDPSGNETVLHAFGRGHQHGPTSDLIRLHHDLFGAATGGGNNGGFVYRIRLDGKFQGVFHQFRRFDAAGPVGQLAIDSEGNIYGTSEQQFGSVFQLTPGGTLNVLYHFPRDIHHRERPRSGVSLDALGNLFGTVSRGGSPGRGAIFEITTTGAESTVYAFTGGPNGHLPNGHLPESPLVLDGAGNIYGTAAGRGGNDGIAYMVTPSGTETILHYFAGCCSNDGLTSGLLRLSSDGKLLGTTPSDGEYGGGTLYVISRRGFEVVHNFGGKTYQGVADGKFPSGGVIDLQGKIYGVTAAGGAYGKGALYEFVRRSASE